MVLTGPIVVPTGSIVVLTGSIVVLTGPIVCVSSLHQRLVGQLEVLSEHAQISGGPGSEHAQLSGEVLVLLHGFSLIL